MKRLRRFPKRVFRGLYARITGKDATFFDIEYDVNKTNEEIERETLEGRRLMGEGRFLSQKPVIATIMAAVDIGLFLLMNFVINLLLSMYRGELVDSLRQLPRMLLPYFSQGNGGLKWIYLFVFAILAIVDVMLWFQIRSSLGERAINIGQRGTQRWATLEEVRMQYAEIPALADEGETEAGGYSFEKGTDRGAGTGVPVCRYEKNDHGKKEGKIYIDTSWTNNLILGITRSGKGEMFVFPMIDIYSRSAAKPSLVINDPKLELFRSSKETLETRGYEVHLLNLVDPLLSMGFNPLSLIVDLWKAGDCDNAEKLAYSVSTMMFNPNAHVGQNQFFYEVGRDVFTALILAHVEDCLELDRLRETDVNEKKINIYSVIHTLTELGSMPDGNKDDPKTMLDQYFLRRDSFDRAKIKYAAINMGEARTTANVFATMLNILSAFTVHSVAAMTAESSIRLRDVGYGKKPMAVFLGLPDYDKSVHVLASIFIRELYFELSLEAQRGRGFCDRGVRFICDEFTSLPPIEGFDEVIKMCLGRHITFDLVIQSYSMMETAYQKSVATTIEGNCANHIYIMTNDIDSAKKFSQELGQKTITTVHRTGSRIGLHKNFSENAEGRALKDENELMKLHEGECIVQRTMVRKDSHGNDITQYPIYNHGQTRFPYRHEYLFDDFPDPDDERCSLARVNTETRSGIDITKLVWDIQGDPTVVEIAAFREKKGAATMQQELLMSLGEAKFNRLVRDLMNKFGKGFIKSYKIDRNMPKSELADIIRAQDADEETQSALLRQMDPQFSLGL